MKNIALTRAFLAMFASVKLLIAIKCSLRVVECVCVCVCVCEWVCVCELFGLCGWI